MSSSSKKSSKSRRKCVTECTTCGEKCDGFGDLFAHFYTAHPELGYRTLKQVGRIVLDAPPFLRYRCDICGEKLPRDDVAIDAHNFYFHQLERCGICDRRVESLDRHLKSRHALNRKMYQKQCCP